MLLKRPWSTNRFFFAFRLSLIQALCAGIYHSIVARKSGAGLPSIGNDFLLLVLLSTPVSFALWYMSYPGIVAHRIELKIAADRLRRRKVKTSEKESENASNDG